MDFLPDPSSKTVAAAVAGAAGGVVRWLTLRERLWPEGVINTVVGSLSALYLGPLAEPMLEKVLGQFDGGENLGSFLIGLGGMTVSNIIIDAWAARRKSIGGVDEQAD